MKRFYLLTLWLISLVVASGANLHKTVCYTSYDLEIDTLSNDGHTYSVIDFGGLISDAIAGAPSLPRHFITIALPPNVKDISAIVYDSISGDVRQLSHRIVPGIQPVPSNYAGNIVLECEESKYQKDSYSSEPLVRVLGAEDYYGINTVVSLMVTPLQYNPHLNMVKRYDSISFKISYNNASDSELIEPEISHLWRKMNAHERRAAYEELKMTVFNPEDILLTFGYDKYGRGDEEPIVIVDNTKKKMRARGEGYVPMLELGKEWRYTVHDCRSYTDVWNDDYEFKYRVDGVTEIDGKEYFIINEYADCPYEEDRMRHYGYMREDLEAKEVYWRPASEYVYNHIGFRFEGAHFPDNEHENENLLYAFGNYDDGHILRPDKTYGHERNLVYAEIEANDGMHRGYMQEGDEFFGCFEGIGLVQRPETIECMGYGWINDLFGFYPTLSGGGEISPFLYAVVAPDGTEIFSIDKHRPGAGLENVEASSGEEAPAEYYNLQGMRILSPTKGTVCIRKQGGSVTKVIIP